MKYILSLIFVISSLLVTLVYSTTPVDSDLFEGNYFNTSCIDAPPYINCQYGNWYMDYIGMQYIYDQNIDLFPTFTVAILDTAIDINHEDIDYNLVRDISTEDNPVLKYDNKEDYAYHGNLVTSLFSAGTIGNGYGGRGIVNTKTLFLSVVSQSDLIVNDDTVSIAYNAQTVLEGIDRLLNPTLTLTLTEGFTKPKIISLSIGVSPKTEINQKGDSF